MNGSFERLKFRGDFVGGRFARPRAAEKWLVPDPGDLDRPVGEAAADPKIVGAAVAAARKAFKGWRAVPPEERVAAVRRYQEAVRAAAGDLAWTISRETGKPLAESRAEAQAMSDKVDVTIKEALPLLAEARFPMAAGTTGAVRRRPRGVVGVIGPFNVPGHLPNGQIVPALLTGNTVVFKPSELTPFTGQLMAECFEKAGFPPGVANMVQGGGRTGAALAAHAEVDALFFTGSVATGRRVQKLAAAAPGKLVALELGGKNAALVLPDARLDAAAAEIAHGAFSTSGQRCSSTSRILVHEKVAEAFLEKLLAKTDALKVGYFTEEPFIGPLVRGAAVDGLLKAETAAKRLGFETLRRARRLETGRRGHYVSPSVHVREGFRALPNRAYWDEELFAPDAAVYVLGSEEEMIAANNASRFGLVASVFTSSGETFRRLAPELENGVVHWNRSTAMTPGRLPFGGVKASGNHWPAGLHVVYACTYPVGSVESAG